MRSNERLYFTRRWMRNPLMSKEVNDTTVFPTVRSVHRFYIPYLGKPHENFRNTHDKFAKRTTGRMN